MWRTQKVFLVGVLIWVMSLSHLQFRGSTKSHLLTVSASVLECQPHLLAVTNPTVQVQGGISSVPRSIISSEQTDIQKIIPDPDSISLSPPIHGSTVVPTKKGSVNKASLLSAKSKRSLLPASRRSLQTSISKGSSSPDHRILFPSTQVPIVPPTQPSLSSPAQVVSSSQISTSNGSNITNSTIAANNTRASSSHVWNSNNTQTSLDDPLESTAGCCAEDMIPRPGLPFDSCNCVYPIRLELVVDDVSTTFANWSGVFQQELASQLGFKVIQIEITSFQIDGPNLSVGIVIGPLTAMSFTVEKAEIVKSDLEQHKVHFNNSLFGNYTLVKFQYSGSPLPLAVQPPNVAIPKLPLPQMLPTAASSSNRSKPRYQLHLWHIFAISTAGFVAVLLLLGLICRYVLLSKKDKKSIKGLACRTISRTVGTGSFATRLFTYDELEQATNNFEPKCVLGEGGFGRVYKGVLRDGTAVAIKRLSGGQQGGHEFVVEVEMLSRLHHRNLVKLIGYFTNEDSSQHLLCYELVPNGNLEAWLHGALGLRMPLGWDTRMQIALDAARGLAYLHEDSQPSVIHRDFKSSNILIDNNFHAKVADFGLAKQAPDGQQNCVTTQVMGTFGYVAPEYAMTGQLLLKSDVYSYGVVLLELLSGRKPVDMSQPFGQENLVTYAQPILRDKEKYGELADPKLCGRYPKEDFAQVAAIAAACVVLEPTQRPTMGEVVESLKMVQRLSEYSTNGDVNALSDNCDNDQGKTFADYEIGTNSSFDTNPLNVEQAVLACESSPSFSTVSSKTYTPFVFENDTFSRSIASSEDLHKGR